MEGRYALHWEMLDKDGYLQADCLGEFDSIEQCTLRAKEFGKFNKIHTRKATLSQELVVFIIDDETLGVHNYCPKTQEFIQ